MLSLTDVRFPKIDPVMARGGEAWLYVFVCGEFVKVGKAKSPVARLATVAGSMPFDVSIWGAYRVPYDLAQLAESFCHSKLVAHHHRGEWFRMAPDPALELVRAIAQLASAAHGGRTARLDIGNHKGLPVYVSAPRTRRFRASAEHFLDTCEISPPKGEHDETR